MTKKQLPLVSIGVPTYYRPAGLRRLLESLIAQTYTNLEIIVSDNCSPNDENERIVKELIQRDARIKYFRQSENVGLFFNFKFVFEQATGDYFAWAADDDTRHPNFIEACINEFKQSDRLVLVNSYSRLVDAQTNQTLAVDKGCTTIGLPAPKRYIKYLTTIYTDQAAVGDLIYGVIKRDALVNAMREQPNILGWDHILLARLALDGEFFTLPEELMESGAYGMSVDNAKAAKSQLIQGSLSERMPVWVRETYQQRTIKTSPNLSWLEKKRLSVWSLSYYLLTHGLKMWVKGLSPQLFSAVKGILSKRSASTT